MKKVIIFMFLFSVVNIIYGAQIVTIDSSKNYQAMDEASSQTKIISDKFGNYYTVFVKRFNGNDQIWVYASYDEGLSWTPLSSVGGPVSIVYGYDQKYPTLVVDNNNGVLYTFWSGADENHTGTFWFDKYQKDQPGDLQIKFSKYQNGEWTKWENISEVDGYNEWVNSSLLNEENYSYNPVIGGKLRVVQYYQMYPSAAVDSRGTVYVVWCGPDKDFTGYQIKMTKSSDFGNTWEQWKNITTESDRMVTTLSGSNIMFFAQIRPKIVIDKNDRIWIFYEGQDYTFQFGASKKFYQKIRYVYSDDYGKTFSSPANVSADAKIEKFVDVVEDDNGNLHIVWSGQLSTDGEEKKRQIRYAIESGGSITAKNYYLSPTYYYEQKYPTISLKGNNPVVYWAGNDTDYPVYEDGDLGTLNINVSSNWTGLYIMRSEYNSINDSWSSYSVIGKGYEPAALKENKSKYFLISYLFATGQDDFRLQVCRDDIVRDDTYSKSVVSKGNNSFYVIPTPVSFKNGENVIIRYEVTQDSSDIEIGVMNLEGKILSTIVSGKRDSGAYQIYWNGRIGDYSGFSGNLIGNMSNPKLSRGIYLIYYKIGQSEKIIKKFIVR